jgi:hypothetical protein
VSRPAITEPPRHARPGARRRRRRAGFWKAVRDVFPETAEQRCWWHKIGNVGVAFKLIESAQARWRAVNAPHLVALVRAGAKFENGKLIERPESDDESQAA